MGKKIKMTISSPEHFDRVFSAIANELVYANVYYDLFRSLNDSFTEYQREVNNSPAFWGISRDSIRDVAFLSLCRVYDPEPNANSLPNLLITIQNNPDFLDKIRTSKPLADGKEMTLPDPLAKVDFDQLKEDLGFVTKENEAVRRLIAWRSSIFVHRNSIQVSTGKAIAKEHVPHYEHLESLLRDGMKIVNRYALLFRFTEHSTQFGQMEDYRFVLDSVRINLQLHKARINAEYQKYGVGLEPFDEKNNPLRKPRD
jgi:AbiU2